MLNFKRAEVYYGRDLPPKLIISQVVCKQYWKGSACLLA